MKFKHFYFVLKRHILVPVAEGNLGKPWHFLVAVIKRKLFGYPYMAVIETGNFCNLKCPTCPTPHNKITRTKDLMSLENFKKVVDNVKDSVYIALLYNTNEPFLNPDILKMAQYANKNNLYASISTNAVLLNKQKTEEVLSSGLDEIIVCLDGTTKESYEQFRVGANFELVLANIRNLCERKQALKLRKPFIELQFILNKFNQDEVESIKALAKELQVDRLHIKPFALGEYIYSKEEIKNLTEKFFPDTEKYQSKVQLEKQGDTLKMKTPPRICSLAKYQTVILVDGSLSMCCYDINGNYLYGNVLDKKLKDIWFSDEVKKKRAQAEKRGYPLCRGCCTY